MSEDGLPIRDVLIVGGGVSGLAASIALGKRGVRTTVLERGTGAVGACIALAERAVYALEELGILDQVKEDGDTVWQTTNPRGVYESDGRRLPIPMPEHGDAWTLPVEVGIYRPLLSEVMCRAAGEHGAELLFGHSYRSLEVADGRVVAELTTGERREFDLLVAADGAHSDLRGRFFPEAPDPAYTGSMSFRMMFEDAPGEWRSGRHVAAGTTISSRMLPGNFFYLAVPHPMERRRVDQAEARELIRTVLENFRPSQMFDEICERLTDDIPIIVAPYEWIFVEPPWHRGPVVLIGDALHATAPTLGMAGGMALEDAVVLAQELAKVGDLDRGLSAYAERRKDRARLVVEVSAKLMHTHQERTHSPQDEAAMRTEALQKLVTPY